MTIWQVPIIMVHDWTDVHCSYSATLHKSWLMLHINSSSVSFHRSPMRYGLLQITWRAQHLSGGAVKISRKNGARRGVEQAINQDVDADAVWTSLIFTALAHDTLFLVPAVLCTRFSIASFRNNHAPFHVRTLDHS